jgi:hypothetical protein
MEISIKELHQDYCMDLNSKWTEAISKYDGVKFDHSDVQTFRDTLTEAQVDGYHFKVIYDPLLIITRSLSVDDEPDLLHSGNFKDIGIINKMIDNFKEIGLDIMIKPLEELRLHRLRKIAVQHFEQRSKANGPFYASEDTSEILVFGFMGDVGLEAALLGLLSSKTKNNTNQNFK